MKSSKKLLQLLNANERDAFVRKPESAPHECHKLTEEDFEKFFPVIQNHLNPQASWTFGDGPGCLFETFGEEHAFVRQQDPRTIWTLLDVDGKECLQNGYHFVNRLGYLISTRPVPDGVCIEVRLSY